MNTSFRRIASTLFAFTLVALSSSAFAEVKKDGTWPADERRISVDFEGNTAEGVKKLAETAGWSLVLPSTSALESTKVAIHVKEQPPTDVLEALLAEGMYVAVRTGNLVRVATSASAAPSPAAAPPLPATPTPPLGQAVAAPLERGEDRVITGKNLTVQKGEVVHDVAVFGGNVDVFGTVTGDLVAVGGQAVVHDGARIVGDATAVGGQLTVEPGASIAGHTGVVGGVLKRQASDGGSHVGISVGESQSEGAKSHRVKEGSSAFSRAALLFAFGAILLALSSKRMETLKLEVVRRPARSFAMGIVGIVGFAVTLIALCVTLVGIPIAILVAIFGSIAGFAGVVAVLTVVGAALAKHKTENVYVHLAIGCALFFLTGLLPFVGSWATVLVTFIGIGVSVATRFGGLLPKSRVS